MAAELAPRNTKDPSGVLEVERGQLHTLRSVLLRDFLEKSSGGKPLSMPYRWLFWHVWVYRRWERAWDRRVPEQSWWVHFFATWAAVWFTGVRVCADATATARRSRRPSFRTPQPRLRDLTGGARWSIRVARDRAPRSRRVRTLRRTRAAARSPGRPSDDDPEPEPLDVTLRRVEVDRPLRGLSSLRSAA